jgi:oligopeptide transport system permease protein
MAYPALKGRAKIRSSLRDCGVLIEDGAKRMEGAWWLLVCPGFFFVATLLALNFLGDGLRDALDPRSGR